MIRLQYTEFRIVSAADFLQLMAHPQFKRLSKLSGAIHHWMVMSLEPPEDAVVRHMPKSEKA